jgi:hypothetical protein
MLSLPRTLGSLTLVSLSLLTYVQAAKQDPCEAIAGNRTANFKDAMACLDYFPFDKDIAQQTVDTVRKVTNELYVFNVNRTNKMSKIKK